HLAVVHALKLAEAFDTTLESPSIAAAIRNVLRDHPAAAEIIRKRILRPKGIDAARRFASGEGRGIALRAPSFDAPDAARGVPLRSSLDPTSGTGIAPIRKPSSRKN